MESTLTLIYTACALFGLLPIASVALAIRAFLNGDL